MTLVFQPLDLRRTRTVNLNVDSLKHGIQIADDLRIPKADHAIALALEPRLPLAISLNVFRLTVMSAIKFDHESFRGAEEVHNIATNRRLATEMRAKCGQHFQSAPQ